MKLKFNGVRGSRPRHKRAMLGFGGNSTSIEFVVDENFHLMIDGGSGLAKRGQELTQNSDKNEFHFLITHTHWDHILGFPFFEPFYSPENKFYFYASNTSRSTFEHLFLGLQRSENLPIPAEALKAQVFFKTIEPNVPFKIGNEILINTFQLNHQGITLGYRVEQNGQSACIVTDNAPIHNGNYLGEGMVAKTPEEQREFERVFEEGLVEFLKDAHTVVFDTHFTEANLKPDWGHSTPQIALDFCKRAGVKRLILFHHAPEDTDRDVTAKIQSILKKSCIEGIDIEAAREGDEWLLSA